MTEIQLPAQQQVLFDLLRNAGDVSIDKLFEAIDGSSEYEGVARQQWLGSYITRMNRRLRAHRLAVRPGALKRTYRLTVV